MKKALLALSLATLSQTVPQTLAITPTPIRNIRQHPSLQRGKSGVAAAKREKKKRKGRLK